MVRLPNDLLADPKWNQEFNARRRVEQAVQAEEKRMKTSAEQFMTTVTEVQKIAKAQGRDMSNAAAMSMINDRHPGSYATAAGYAPQPARNATEEKFQKAVQTSMLAGNPYAVAVQKVFSADADLFRAFLKSRGVPV